VTKFRIMFNANLVTLQGATETFKNGTWVTC